MELLLSLSDSGHIDEIPIRNGYNQVFDVVVRRCGTPRL